MKCVVVDRLNKVVVRTLLHRLDSRFDRAKGRELAEGIRADADRQKRVIVAEAYRESEEIRGDGDAKAAAIYAKAYGQDPEFYAFYRSLGAYRDSFASKSDVLVLAGASEQRFQIFDMRSHDELVAPALEQIQHLAARRFDQCRFRRQYFFDAIWQQPAVYRCHFAIPLSVLDPDSEFFRYLQQSKP